MSGNRLCSGSRSQFLVLIAVSLFAQLDKDDMVYMEAYDKLLESWLTLVQDEEHFPRGCFVQPAIQVFNSYIQCHLAAPDGTRNLVRTWVYLRVLNLATNQALLSVSVTLCFL